MKLSTLITQLQKLQNDGIDYNVVIDQYPHHPSKIFHFELGVIGNVGEFVDQSEVKRRKWDSIIDTICIF